MNEIFRTFAIFLLMMILTFSRPCSVYNDYSVDNVTINVVIDGEEKEFTDGWTTTYVNVRKEPDINSDVLAIYRYDKKVEYAEYNEDWVQIIYGDTYAYIFKTYISDEEPKYRDFTAPQNSGFKSYMPYRAITATDSPQYRLQMSDAYTGSYGIRQVDGRYCVAIGSYFTTKIGTYFDLILENGTVIPCILGDQKADEDTDSQNIITEHNGCMTEFIVDTNSLSKRAKQYGDISYCCEDWKSPVKTVRVYEGKGDLE